MDLQVSVPTGEVPPSVSKESRGNRNTIVLTDRVYEHKHLLNILEGLFSRKALFGRFKSDDAVLNLCLLSLQLDFGLCEQYAGLLNIPFLKSLKRGGQLDKKELQVRVTLCTPALLLALTTPISHPLSVCVPLAGGGLELDQRVHKKNTSDSVTRLKVEMLLFEASYNFIVNKNFPRSKTFELIQMLKQHPIYQQYLLLVKIYTSLCQINKSVEVDYYKIFCNNDYRIIIPYNFSKATSDYLDDVTKQYTFWERDGYINYGELALFDVRAPQPEIHLYKVRRTGSPPPSHLLPAAGSPSPPPSTPSLPSHTSPPLLPSPFRCASTRRRPSARWSNTLRSRTSSERWTVSQSI